MPGLNGRIVPDRPAFEVWDCNDRAMSAAQEKAVTNQCAQMTELSPEARLARAEPRPQAAAHRRAAARRGDLVAVSEKL